MPRASKSRRLIGTTVPLALGTVLIWSVPGAGAADVFRLGRWNGFVEQTLELNQHDQVAVGIERPLFKRTGAQERVGLRNTGTRFGRGVLTVNFGVDLGFEQRRLSVGGEPSEGGRGRLHGFDVTATILPRKSFDLTLVANRLENLTPVEFAGNRRLRTSSQGLSMRFGGQAFPGQLRVRNSHLESVSEFGTRVRGLDQRQRSVSYSGQNRWDRQQLHTFFQIRDVRDRVTPTSSNETLSANLGHTVELLVPDLATLRSTVSYFDRGGALNSTTIHVNEDLRLRHRENLWTGLQLELRSLDNFSGQSSNSWRGHAWLRHSLWESLETEFRVSTKHVTSDHGYSDLGEARLRLRYKKNVPLSGRLRGSLTVGYADRDNLRGDGEEFVSQERHTARFGVPFLLDRPRPVAGSLVVTDELDATIYEEGIDYELRFFDEFAEIFSLPGGRIVDGQQILVDYFVEAPVQTRSAALTTNADVSVNYGWIEPFIRYRRTDDRLRAGVQHALNEDRTDGIIGVWFRKNNRWLKFLAFGEWRSRESRLQGIDSLRFATNLVYTPGRAWGLTGNLVHIDNRFDASERDVQIDEGRLSLRWRPRAVLSLEIYGRDRITRDTLAADQNHAQLGLDVRWNLGKLSLISSAEYWWRGRSGDDLEGLSASVRITRRFFPGTVTVPRRPTPMEPWPEDLPSSGTGPQEPVEDGELLGSPAEQEPEEDPEAPNDETNDGP